MSLFNVNIPNLVKKLLPPVQREILPLNDLIVSYLEPVQNIFDQLDTDTDKNLIRARASGQIIKMRKALILLTGIDGITINVDTTSLAVFHYLTSESQPVYYSLTSEASPQYVYLAAETAVSIHSFTIGVPAASLTTAIEDQIRAELAIFGPPTTDFQIVAI